jgi:hypothetical protein
MTEFNFDGYVGQLRPLAWRDMEVVAQVERELLADLGRAQAKEPTSGREERNVTCRTDGNHGQSEPHTERGPERKETE